MLFAKTTVTPRSDLARFSIRFDRWYRVLSSALLLRPRASYVEIADDTVTARMGWAFATTFPRAAVVRTSRLDHAPLSRGVHGFAGRWLVNGSGDRILVIDLEPAQRARVIGVPIKLRQLAVSVEDPDALANQLRSA
jgi:hypothetical protein